MSQPVATWGDPTKLFAASPADLVIVGGVWFAPYGTPLPTDVDEPLDGAFQNLGYVGVDGVTITVNDETTPIEVWGGDEVGALRDTFSIEYEVPLLQVLSPTVAAAAWGEEAVSTSPATASQGNRMRVLINNKIPKRCSLVVDSVYEDKRLRQVAAIAQKSSIGEMKLVHNEVLSYTVTWKVLRGPEGHHVAQYSDDGQLVGSI